MSTKHYDYIIVGSGISGAIVANELGKAGKNVLIVEASDEMPTYRNEFLKNFFNANMKTPSSPYPPMITENNNPDDPSNPSKLNTPRPTIPGLINWSDPSKSYLTYDKTKSRAFASGYERITGGTTWHWLGTSLRFFESDFNMNSLYGVLKDWPINYNDLTDYYDKAEQHIIVAGNKESQEKYGVEFNPDYEYPQPAVELSLVDEMFNDNLGDLQIDGKDIYISATPQARLTQIEQNEKRPQCAGNTSCIPLCPIQAKYDATLTLKEALQHDNVEIQYKSVVSSLDVDSKTDKICGVNYVTYDEQNGPKTGEGKVTADNYILAAHAIETPKIMLNSPWNGTTVANSSNQVGANLMDHTIYLAWGLSAKDKPVYPYRGPLSTSGIESMREGKFRAKRAAYRIEIGNEGWNWAAGDPQATVGDFVFGTNFTQTNPEGKKLQGKELVDQLNDLYIRQLRLGFLIEQSPEEENRVTLSTTETDNLGIPRPHIEYNLSEYTKEGFVSAKDTASKIFAQIGATEYTKPPAAFTDPEQNGTFFNYKGDNYQFYGAGHVVGTTVMGNDKKTSVVNEDLQSWDHDNLYIIGSSVFPTITTANPTLTIAAMALRLADKLISTKTTN